MRAQELAFYFLLVNISIFMVEQTGVFGLGVVQTTNSIEDFHASITVDDGSRWFNSTNTWTGNESLITRGVNTLEQLVGLSVLLLKGIELFTRFIPALLTGIGDLAVFLLPGQPTQIGVMINMIVTLTYLYTIITFLTNRQVDD